MCQQTRSSLLQIMACRLDGAKPLSEQCRNIANWTLRNKFQWVFFSKFIISIPGNAFQNVVWEMTAILFRTQYVKMMFGDGQSPLGDMWYRADSRFAPNQWETALLGNDVPHWLGTSLNQPCNTCTPPSVTGTSQTYFHKQPIGDKHHTHCDYKFRHHFSQISSANYIEYFFAI